MKKRVFRNIVFFTVSVLLAFALTTTAFAAEYTFTEGQEIVDYCVYSTVSSELKSAELVIGNLPEGMSYKVSGIGLMLYGKPASAGSFTAEFRTLEHSEENGDFEGSVSVTITVVEPEHTELTITKSPTSETVELNGAALFIASAENYNTIQWRVVNADGSNCWRGKSEIESGFAGVTYNSYKGNDGREYLELSSIPSSMNNYYVQAMFTDPNGNYKLSESAYVAVNGADANEVPVSPEEPEVQPEEPEQVPELQIPAEETPQVTMVEVTPEPETEPTKENEKKSSKNRPDNLGALVLAGAAAVGAAVATAVYISLKKSEKKRTEQDSKN